jgi:hypothetical protein
LQRLPGGKRFTGCDSVVTSSSNDTDNFAFKVNFAWYSSVVFVAKTELPVRVFSERVNLARRSDQERGIPTRSYM